MKASLIPLTFFVSIAIVGVTYAQSTTRVSVSAEGLQSDNHSRANSDQAISADGSQVLFNSLAANLVPGDTNGVGDYFVHDRLTGEIERISVDSSGVEANADYFFIAYAAISANGRVVAFNSTATNLVAGDTNGLQDVFVHDRDTGQTTRVSVSSAGVEANNTSGFLSAPSISADGRYVAFSSSASNLVAGDTNNNSDVFLHDRNTGVTTLLSVDSSGFQGNSGSSNPALSGDGQIVAFDSGATNLVPGDSNLSTDTFVHDRTTGVTTRVSVSSAGLQGDFGGSGPTISGDGQWIAFASSSTNLVVGDTNGFRDVYLHDRLTGQTSRVSLGPGGIEGNESCFEPSLSGDGAFVAYYSNATNLFPGGDANGADLDSFLYERSTGSTTPISVDSVGTQSNDVAVVRALSSDGQFAVIQGIASNLVPGDTNVFEDIFVHNRLGPSLTKSGSCPGAMVLTVSGGTVGQNVAVVYGPAGFFIKPTPPCQGIELGISAPQLGAMIPTNAAGIATLSFNAPSGACGLTVQGVDLNSCGVSNPLVL